MRPAGRLAVDEPAGLLVVDKPAGPTSHDVVALVRRALDTRRVGHAGTLDPFATGLLACCVGPATRLARYLSGHDKRYRGLARFGQATATGDATGPPLGDPVAARLDEATVRAVLPRLEGAIEQVPPMYSAKKRGGVPLHVLARRGEEVERAPVPVRVGGWEVTVAAPDLLRFEVTCSSGTYVRVLVEDLGRLLGVPAHLAELRRLTSGPLTLVGAVPGDALDAEAARRALRSIDDFPLALPIARLHDAAAAGRFASGAAVSAAAWHEETAVPLDTHLDGRLDGRRDTHLDRRLDVRDPGTRRLGVARLGPRGELLPETVLPGGLAAAAP